MSEKRLNSHPTLHLAEFLPSEYSGLRRVCSIDQKEKSALGQVSKTFYPVSYMAIAAIAVIRATQTFSKSVIALAIGFRSTDVCKDFERVQTKNPLRTWQVFLPCQSFDFQFQV